jgi:hypothetical protein
VSPLAVSCIIAGFLFTYVILAARAYCCLRGAVATFLKASVATDLGGWVETGVIVGVFGTSRVYDVLAVLMVEGFVDRRLENPAGARAQLRNGHRIASYRWKGNP